MDWRNYLNIGISLLIGIFIGWLLFRSTTPEKFIGLSPLIDEISAHTSIFMDNSDYKDNKDKDKDPVSVEKNKKKDEKKSTGRPFTSKGELECLRAAN
jgi:hypothetical protein